MNLIKEVVNHINSLSDIDAKVEFINLIRQEIHEASPFKEEPVDLVIWAKNEEVRANNYNPNSVAPPEMELLKVSILEDGYTQPIVSFKEDGLNTVVDGFHRSRVGRECKEVTERVKGYLPIVRINEKKEGREERIASTIRHNRARGKHAVDEMSKLVVELKRRNWSDKKISKELGMDQDEVLRLTQISGLAEMFMDKDFTMSWVGEFSTEEEE